MSWIAPVGVWSVLNVKCIVSIIIMCYLSGLICDLKTFLY